MQPARAGDAVLAAAAHQPHLEIQTRWRALQTALEQSDKQSSPPAKSENVQTKCHLHSKGEEGKGVLFQGYYCKKLRNL